MGDVRLGQVLDGRYRIHGQLAAGGMGVVYRAERVGLGKQVAVKFLHRTSALMPQHRTRFEREATAMSRLTHPNLVSVIDHGSHDGLPYLVMEYHPGTTLKRALGDGPLAPERAVFIARQMLAGLASAHASGVVHRDLKPANVLLCGAPGEDLVKILDFGVAKLLDAGGGPTEVSVVAGTVLGTPSYMSPEHARAQPIDGRSDVYAVGVMLYEMVTGRRPFEGAGKLGILRMQVEDRPVSPRERVETLSRELSAAILRAMEKEPEARFPSAAEFAAALALVPEGRAGRQLLDRRDRYPEGEPPRTRVRFGRAALVGLVLGGILVGGLWGAVELGFIEIPIEWLERVPWVRWTSWL
jgi:serine/threonine-protein kinase